MRYRKVAVALLAGFYPALFFLSNNWHIFSIPQSLVLLVGTSLVSLVLLFSIAYLLDVILRKLSGEKHATDESSDGRRPFFDSCLTVCALAVCVFLLRNTLLSIDIHSVILHVTIATVIVCFTWASFKKGLRPILHALVILSSLSIANFFISGHIKTELPIEEWATKSKAAHSKIQFRKKPNVHLIVTESYPSKPALRAVYGIENSLFYRNMQGLGVKFNHHHFSNYNHTLSSLPSLFSMAHHYGMINIASFESLGGRRMLEARLYNPVIEIFRSNNYKIQYLHDVSGLIPHGADVDFCMPSPTVLHGLKVFLTKQNLIEQPPDDHHHSESLDSIRRQIAATIQEDTPYFNFIYVNFPGHSPSRLREHSKSDVNLSLGKFRHAYDEQIASANQRLLDLLKLIIGRDPDSIILLIGDHGSWGYRFKEDGQGNPISNQLYILDRFGVLAGIRGPDELSDLMANGTIKSHVNLFRYVFEYLSDNPAVLPAKAPDNSYDRPFLLAIKDGNILEDFVQTRPVFKEAGRTAPTN